MISVAERNILSVEYKKDAQGVVAGTLAIDPTDKEGEIKPLLRRESPSFYVSSLG